MFPLEQDYLALCDWAHDALHAETLLARLSDENLLQLRGLVRNEAASCPGRPPVLIAIIAAVIDDAVMARGLEQQK